METQLVPAESTTGGKTDARNTEQCRISRQEGFEVIDAEVRLEGYCPECKRRLSDRMTDTEQDTKRRR